MNFNTLANHQFINRNLLRPLGAAGFDSTESLFGKS